ncbi:MAG: nitrous oxide reductase family maturation protein NosD [Haloferacaceae archaeon]
MTRDDGAGDRTGVVPVASLVPAVAVVVLVASVTALFAAPGAATARPTIRKPVPDEYSFSPPTREGVATVDGRRFDSVQAAVDAAHPGDVIRLAGRFDERVVVDVSNVTLTSERGTLALIDGSGEGDVLTIDGDDVTVRHVWVRNSGYDPASNDAAVWVNGTNATVVDGRVTETTFGIWLDGVDGARVVNNTIVGRERIHPLSDRGNGIEIWKTTNTRIRDNRITDVRDGVYYSWASGVTASGNVLWDLRYGVHYMYSDDCVLRNNLAFDDDVGFTLMVSQRLRIENNTAFNNTGPSGHGILVKSVDDTLIRNNTLIANGDGLYVYNSVDDTIDRNLVLGNHVGIDLQAGSVRETIVNNSVIGNDRPVLTYTSEQLAWNTSTRGNYWSGAQTTDVDGDGIADARYRPAGLVERLTQTRPLARVFADSPAFQVIRLAESSVPLIRSPGVVDYHPLVDPPHDRWRRYYERD